MKEDNFNDNLEDDEDDVPEEEMWTQFSRERSPYESDEDYKERMEDLDNFYDHFN